MNTDCAFVVAVLTIAVLLFACYFDYRYRQVPNVFWWAIGIIGMVSTLLSGLEQCGFKAQYVLCFAGMALILMGMLLFDIKDARTLWLLRIICAFCIIAPCIVEIDVLSRRVLIIGIVFVVLYALYVSGIIIGGADIKCLVTLSFVFQTCPSFGGFPMIAVPSSVEYLFPFSFVVLFYASVLSLVILLQIVIRKMYRKTDPIRGVSPGCYVMKISEARKSHVWAKQDVRDGMVVNANHIPDEGVYDRLESVGAETVIVTPIVPFIIFITIAVVVTLVVGNVFFLPFNS